MTDQLIEAAIKISGVHKKIVDEVWPHGVIARCGYCGATQYLNADETAKCLATGWPKCCGRSMPVKGAPAPR